MADHCYADRDQFWRYLADQGADAWRDDDTLVLALLRAASRTVDGFCRRTGAAHVTSGFGPRFDVHWYDPVTHDLDFDDDLLNLSALEVAQTTGGPLTPWTSGLHYLLQPYTRLPQRTLVVLAGSALPRGLRLVRATGKWGYDDTRTAAIAATVAAGGWSADAASIAFGGDASFVAIGQTLWCEAEALLVVDLTSAGASVIRGAHGTTAAPHAQGTALHVQAYDPSVTLATLQIALRRWKHRAVGLSGDYGGVGGVPSVSEKAVENDILRSLVGHLAFVGGG